MLMDDVFSTTEEVRTPLARTSTPPVLSSMVAFSMICKCGFIVSKNWKPLLSYLGVSLDHRNRLEIQAKTNNDYNHALEEGLDIWLTTDYDKSWEKLIKGVQHLEPATASLLRQSINIKEIPVAVSYRNHCLALEAAGILQRHAKEICSIIRDPSPIARELFEHRIVNESCYLATLSTHSLNGSSSSHTWSLLETVYRSTREYCRMDIVSILVSILEDIHLIRPIALRMREELDQILLRSVTTMNNGDWSMTTAEPRPENMPTAVPRHETIPIAVPCPETIPTAVPHPETIPTVNHSNEDFIQVVLTLTSEQKFDNMRMKFGTLLKNLRTALDTKPVSLDELKEQIIYSFGDLEDSIEPCSSSADVIKILRKTNYCTFIKCSVVERLAEDFNLDQIREELRVYCIEREVYFETIKLEDFVQEAQESIGRNRKVVFHLDWKKDKKALAEFEQLLRAVFQEAEKYITLKQVRDGSVVMVCECPESMVECLKLIVRGKEELLASYGVLMLTIGETVVMMKRKPEICSVVDRSLSSGFRTRSRNSSNSSIREIPESSLLLEDPQEDPSLSAATPISSHTYHVISLPADPKPHISFSSKSKSLPHSMVPQSMGQSPLAITHSKTQRTKSESGPHPYHPSRSISYGTSVPSRPPVFTPPTSSLPAPSLISQTPTTSLPAPPTASLPAPPTEPVPPIPARVESSPLSDDSSLESLSDLIMSHSPIELKQPDATVTDLSTSNCTSHSSYIVTVDEDPLNQYPWYWEYTLREDVIKRLNGEQDGSFVVTKSTTSPSVSMRYTLAFRHNGNTKHFLVLSTNGKYCLKGIGHTKFDSLPSLIIHYSNTSLPLHDDKYPVKLEYPVIKMNIKEDVDGPLPDIKKTLKAYKDILKQFNEKLEDYESKQSQKLETKQTLQSLERSVSGYKMTAELLESSRNVLDQNFNTERQKRDSSHQSFNIMTASFKNLGTMKGEMEEQLSVSASELETTQNHYRNLEKMCSYTLMELRSISNERDTILSQLTSGGGLTIEEIYEMIETTPTSSSEDTYMRFYKRQLDMDSSDVYEYVIHRPRRHEGVVRYPRNEYDYPTLGDPTLGEWTRKGEPFYERLSLDEFPTNIGGIGPPPNTDTTTGTTAGAIGIRRAWTTTGVTGVICATTGTTTHGSPTHSVTTGTTIHTATTSSTTTSPIRSATIGGTTIHGSPTRSATTGGTTIGGTTTHGSPTRSANTGAKYSSPSSSAPSSPVSGTRRKKIVGWSPTTWYCQVDHKTAERLLCREKVGTFLCRPIELELSASPTESTHVYTVHLMSDDGIKNLKVYQHRDMFGFRTPCTFNSLHDLIIYHANTSLEMYDNTITGSLQYPIKGSTKR